MFGLTPTFWLKLVLLIVGVFVLFFLFNTVLSKWLKIKRRGFFSYKHVNEKHKIIDWTIRITFIFIILIGSYINAERHPTERIWLLEPWIIVFGLIILTELVRAYMEWKYEENKNKYILTLSELVFAAILVMIVFKTNFFGMV